MQQSTHPPATLPSTSTASPTMISWSMRRHPPLATLLPHHTGPPQAPQGRGGPRRNPPRCLCSVSVHIGGAYRGLYSNPPTIHLRSTNYPPIPYPISPQWSTGGTIIVQPPASPRPPPPAGTQPRGWAALPPSIGVPCLGFDLPCPPSLQGGGAYNMDYRAYYTGGMVEPARPSPIGALYGGNRAYMASGPGNLGIRENSWPSPYCTINACGPPQGHPVPWGDWRNSNVGAWDWINSHRVPPGCAVDSHYPRDWIGAGGAGHVLLS
jgi:hypothetical protein